MTRWRADDGWSAAERTRGARARRLAIVQDLFAAADVRYPPARLLLRAFKASARLEAWASSTSRTELKRIATYEICAASGRLGPKRKEGDRQVPEGFYRLNFFNSQSRFHLSMQVSYPNRSDRILGHKKTPGGEIMIHGNCRSIGCIAVGDERIEELWVMARDAAQPVHVHVFPADDMDALLNNEPLHQHAPFWKNLREGWALFEKTRRIPHVTIRSDGAYAFTSPR